MSNSFKSQNYILIQGWMVNELDLKGNELLIYAMIFGFTQEENQWYCGSLSYMMKAINCQSKTTIAKCLQSLIDKEYILKEIYEVNNVKLCKYKINGRVYQKMVWGIPKNGINNTIYNINSNNNKKEISIINEESINEEKEINKEKEEIDIFQYVEENFGRTLSPIEYEEISSWEDNDLTRYAIKQTILKGIYNLNYIKRILENYKLKKISTIEQAKQEEENFRNGYSNKIKQVVELDDYDWLNE